MMKKCKLCGKEATMSLSSGGEDVSLCRSCWKRVIAALSRSKMGV